MRRWKAARSWFDKLTMSARPEPFDSPLILSLSKDAAFAVSAFNVVSSGIGHCLS
jgi:hypothetical protein